MTLVAARLEQAGTDDVELIRLVGTGDRAALATLYERHAGWLTVRLSRRCGDPDLVDTVLQDTFLAVWKQADGYRSTGDVGAWIWTIALRRLIDQLRKRRPPEPMADVTPFSSPVANPFSAVVAEEIPLALGHTDMGQAFARLDPDLQAVMAATTLDGLTNTEAAALLGVPVGTVKSRLSRARQILKEALR